MAITYTPTTNFGAKDSLPTNDPDKVIKGSEFTTEFTALQTAFSLAAPNASPTFTGTVTIPTADINGGAIDGTTIGGTTPAAATFTSVTATTADINGGNIDGTVIGAATPAAGSFTTITASDDVNFDSGTFFVDASANNVGIGTSSPKTTLNLSANNSGQGPILTLENSDTSITTNDVLGQIDFYGNDGSTGGSGQKATIKALAENSSGTSVGLSFGTSPFPDTTATERMRIDASGNVGIACTPDTALNAFGYKVLEVAGANTTKSGALLLSNSAGTDFGQIYADDTAGWKFVNAQTTKSTIFYGGASTSEQMRIDSSGNLLLGTTSATFVSTGRKCFEVNGATNSIINLADESSGSKVSKFYIHNDASNNYINHFAANGVSQLWWTQGSERMRLDTSGNLLVGKTTTALGTAGSYLASGGNAYFTATNNQLLVLNRLSTDGSLAEFYKDGSAVGSIGTNSDGDFCFTGASNVGIGFQGNAFVPLNGLSARTDNSKDVGAASVRFDDIYATNGTIQTSDANEKENIRELLEAEARVAQAAKGLLRAFQWKDSVAEKGDDARIHFGIIAQDLQAAFEAEGLDAGRYAMFIHSTWTDEETGEERSRMGVRYSELLAFIIAAL